MKYPPPRVDNSWYSMEGCAIIFYYSVSLLFDKIRRKVEKTRQCSVWCSSQHLHLSHTLLHTSLASQGIKDRITYSVVEGCRLRPAHSVSTLFFSPLPQDNFQVVFPSVNAAFRARLFWTSCGGHTSSEQILENSVHGPVHSPAFPIFTTYIVNMHFSGH